MVITLKDNDSDLWPIVYDIYLIIEELSKDNAISKREIKFKLIQQMHEINLYDDNEKTYKLNL